RHGDALTLGGRVGIIRLVVGLRAEDDRRAGGLRHDLDLRQPAIDQRQFSLADDALTLGILRNRENPVGAIGRRFQVLIDPAIVVILMAARFARRAAAFAFWQVNPQ